MVGDKLQKLLIIYDSINGTSANAAEIIAKELSRDFKISVFPVEYAPVPDDFDAVVIGSYIRYGKVSGPVRRYIKKHQAALCARTTVHYFSCMHLARTTDHYQIPVYYDPAFSQQPLPLGKMTFADRQHAASLYLDKLLKINPAVRGVAFFKGRMHYGALPIFDRIAMRTMGIFMKAAREGDSFTPEQPRAIALELHHIIRENT